VSQTVVIQHEISLAPKTISHALAEAGFEIESIIQDPPAESDRIGDEHPQAHLPEQVVMRWRSIRGHRKDGEESGRARHVERCDMCRAEEAAAGSKPMTFHAVISPKELSQQKEEGRRNKDQLPDVASKGLPDHPLMAVHVSPPSKLVRASLSISGMTCSSCVGKITEALRSKTWIQSVDVSLLTNSASVDFYGREHLRDVTDAIKAAGYEATIHESEELQDLRSPGSPLTDDTWRATYAIAGMTCSSCVGSITRALEMFDWVVRVEVNLISNSATVVFKGKSHLREIAKAVQELGYDAKLSIVDDPNRAHQQDSQRMVTIRIDGMYCDHCPLRILEALKAHGTGLKIEGTLTRRNPFLKVAYVPDAPEFTIRHILASISATDPAFEASIYHPPTLEERSQKMQAHQRRRLLLRLILSITAAIPTFIIGIVFMNFLSPSHPSRQYLMHPIWSGNVSRAEWAQFIMATPVHFFAADLFHRRAIAEVRALWRPGSQTPILQRFYRFGSMDMLMSLGISIAYFSSIAVLAIDATQPSDAAAMKGNSSYFDAVVFLTMFLLIGRLLEAFSKAKAGDAVTMLGKLRPTDAILIDYTGNDVGDDRSHLGRRSKSVRIDLLEYGDMVRVLHGGSPPCDGVVMEGESSFDESSLTGESRLVGKSVGDEVFSGTINKGDPISIQISRVSGASMLDQIVAAVREGQTRRAPIERVADVLTSYFVPFVTLIAVSVWIIWLSLGLSGSLPQSYLDISVGGWPFWSLQFAIAVFVIACPCGIGLAAPTALFVGGGLAAKHGILVKGGGEAFQEASDLDYIVFDKTGTLTQGGEPAITDHEFIAREDSKLILSTVKVLEESSGHPIAKAVVSFCDARETQNVHSTSVEEIAGKGMKGSFVTETMKDQEIEVLIGNEALMKDFNVDISKSGVATLDGWKAQGKSVALVAMRYVPKNASTTRTTLKTETTWNLSAIFAAADPLRPEACDVIRALRGRGIDVWMISGDNSTTTYAVGDMVGIPRTNIIAGVLPDQKAEKIRYLQKSLKKSNVRTILGGREHRDKRAIIAMVGDGINDSPALAMADVGIAIGSGSDIAISSAEFVLISSGLTSLLTLIDLSRTVFSRIKFNFAWALVYNMLALPVAAGVLYPIKSSGGHVRLDPVWASVAMALSSLSVVCSSLLLRTRLPVVGFRLGEKDSDSKLRVFADNIV
jgi:heavy metal translocating P-type ATPase